MTTIKRISDFIARWIGLVVLLAALFSLAFPGVCNHIEMRAINPMLGVIMFGMGLTLSLDDFRVVLSRPLDILIGCIAQFAAMPLLALLLVKLFALPADLALGVILVGCCPGGTASNVITYLAKGDLALSVGMTAVSTLLAPLLTPLLTLLLAGTFVDVDAAGMLLSIVYVVIAPILGGFLVQKLMPRFTERVLPYLPAFSSLVIAVVVAIIVSHTAERLLGSGVLIILVVALHNIGGLMLGYMAGLLCRLPMHKRAAISIEVGMQNSGLASSLATMHFAAFPLAAIPGAIFSVWHNISGAIVARIYSSRIEGK